jgi:hypothetical protein
MGKREGKCRKLKKGGGCIKRGRAGSKEGRRPIRKGWNVGAVDQGRKGNCITYERGGGGQDWVVEELTKVTSQEMASNGGSSPAC